MSHGKILVLIVLVFGMASLGAAEDNIYNDDSSYGSSDYTTTISTSQPIYLSHFQWYKSTSSPTASVTIRIKFNGNTVASKTKSVSGGNSCTDSTFTFSKSDYSTIPDSDFTVEWDGDGTQYHRRETGFSYTGSLMSINSETVPGNDNCDNAGSTPVLTFKDGNNPPSFNSTSVSPNPPLVAKNVSYSAEVYDPDGSVDYTNLTVDYGGSTVVSNEKRTGTTPSWNDIFEPSNGNNWLNATLTAKDDAGATTTKEINKYLEDNPPNNNIELFKNKTYYKYRQNMRVKPGDNDSVPKENYTCNVDFGNINTQDQFEEENDPEEYYGGQTDLGRHTANVTCSDDAGNTNTTLIDYTVDNFDLQSVSSGASAFETSLTPYNIGLKAGKMVKNWTANLYYNNSLRKSETYTNSGITTFSETINYRPNLVSSNNTAFNWSIETSVNYEEFPSKDILNEKENSTNKTQNLYFSYHTPKVNSNKSDVIEKQSFNSILDFTNELNNRIANIEFFQSIGGNTQKGENVDIEFPLLPNTNKDTKTISGTLNLEYRNKELNRTGAADSVTGYKKILTDCNNAVNGVTGTKALTYKLKREDKKTQSVSGDINYNFDVTRTGKHSRNYAFNITNKTSAETCIYPKFAEYRVNGPVEYSSDKDQNQFNLVFPQRKLEYNDTLTNTSETRNLYLLPQTDTVQTIFKVVDSANNPVEDVKIKVMRYFPGSNSFLTVTSKKTNNNGEAQAQLKPGTDYKYILTKNAEVLETTGIDELICSTIPCTKTFQVGNDVSPYFKVKEGFDYKISKLKNQNGSVNGLQATVNHDSGSISNANLKVSKNGVVRNSKICDINVQNPGVSMVCQFNSTADENRFYYELTGSKNGFTYSLDKDSFGTNKGLFEDSNPMAALILFLVVSMIGVGNPKTGIAFSTAGFLLTWWIGLISLSLASAASIVIIAGAVALTGGGRR